MERESTDRDATRLFYGAFGPQLTPRLPWSSHPRKVRVRVQRLRAARAVATHTADQWQALVVEFDARCVRCGAEGQRLERDHIVPLFLGGSDGIENIQPLCRPCNCSKGPETTDWRDVRRAQGFPAA